MRKLFGPGLGMIAGIAIGATAIQGLHAQNKAPAAYVVIDVSEISDPAAFGQAVQKTGPITDATGGHFVVRTDKVVPLYGTPPKRFVILSFASAEKAKAWADNSTMKELQPEIDKYSKQRRFIVEGM